MEQLIAEVRQYIDLRLKYFKLQTVEKLSLFSGKVLSVVAFVVFLWLAFMFLSVALVIVVSEWVGSLTWGLVIVGGLFLLLALLCLALRNTLFSSTMVKTFTGLLFTENMDDEDEYEL
jgi:protein-S-isoprenylcysteine O-methyltransferase Ste14